jgi:hypothetical protein
MREHRQTGVPAIEAEAFDPFAASWGTGVTRYGEAATEGVSGAAKTSFMKKCEAGA